MTFKDKVNQAIKEVLNERNDLFLIDVKISDNYGIKIVIDGDNGINLDDCINLSRSVEAKLDRDDADFSLEVASAGAASPLKLSRQYKKNIGRKLKVITLSNEVIEAQITNADEEAITLEWIAREPKKIGKGKETVEKKLILPYNEIKEATVIISF